MVQLKKNTTVKKETAPVLNAEEVLVVTASETVAVKIKATGEYANWGIELFHSKQLQPGQDAADVFDDMVEALEERVATFADRQTPLSNADIVRETQVRTETLDEPPIRDKEPEGAGEEVLGAVEEGLTEDMVREMERTELIELIKEQEIELDPKAPEYKKTADLAEAVIAILFAEPGDEITEDMVREMERTELIELIADQEVDINEEDYKKTADLAEAIIEILFAEPLNADGVREMSREDLISLIEQEELKIKSKDYKKTEDLAEAIIAELFVDDGTGTDGAGTDEFGDFDNVS